MENIIIQFTIGQIFTGSFFVILCFGLLQLLLSSWLRTRIEQSIHHEYNKEIEKYKFSQLQRQKAESVARLFARWIKYRGKENVILNKMKLFDYHEDLSQMSIQIALWIDDKTLLEEIMARLGNEPNAKSVHDLIGDVRRLVLDNKKDSFDSNKVRIWPKE